MVVLLWVSLVQAQGSANSSCGNATGSGGSVAYSVGQVIYTTNTSISGSVTQGVQHAWPFYFGEGASGALNFKSNSLYVRAVRAF